MEALLQAAQAIRGLSNQETLAATAQPPTNTRKSRRASTHTIDTSSVDTEDTIAPDIPSRTKKRGKDRRQSRREKRNGQSLEEDSTDIHSPSPKQHRRNRRRPINRPVATRRSSMTVHDAEVSEARNSQETDEGTESPVFTSHKGPKINKTGYAAQQIRREQRGIRKRGRRPEKSPPREFTEDTTSEATVETTPQVEKRKAYINYYGKAKRKEANVREQHEEHATRRGVQQAYWDRHPKWLPDAHAGQVLREHNAPPTPRARRRRLNTDPHMTDGGEIHERPPSDQDRTSSQQHHTRPRTCLTAHPPKTASMQSKPPPPPPRQIFEERDHQIMIKPPPPPPPFCPCVGILTGQRPSTDRPPCGRTIIPTRPHPEPQPIADARRIIPTDRRPSDRLAWNHREEVIMHKPRADKAWLQSGRDPHKPIYLRPPHSSEDSSTTDEPRMEAPHVAEAQPRREPPSLSLDNTVHAKSQMPSRRSSNEEYPQHSLQACPKAQTRRAENWRRTTRGPKPTPYSTNINVTFRGGSPPQYNKALHLKYTAMAKNNPQKLRCRIKADIRYMKSHKFCNHRALNYNLYRSYSLSISELKDLFRATSLGDLIHMCMEEAHDERQFGPQDAQQSFLQHTDDEEEEMRNAPKRRRTQQDRQAPASSYPAPTKETTVPIEQAVFTTPRRQAS